MLAWYVSPWRSWREIFMNVIAQGIEKEGPERERWLPFGDYKVINSRTPWLVSFLSGNWLPRWIQDDIKFIQAERWQLVSHLVALLPLGPFSSPGYDTAYSINWLCSCPYWPTSTLLSRLLCRNPSKPSSALSANAIVEWLSVEVEFSSASERRSRMKWERMIDVILENKPIMRQRGWRVGLSVRPYTSSRIKNRDKSNIC